MKPRHALTFIILGLTATGLLVYSLSQEVIRLAANDNVSAYVSEMWSYQDTPTAIIAAGEEVPVAGCASDKSDISVIVQLDGRKLYVGPGNYVLRKRRATLIEAWSDRRATFSCIGLLPGVSRQAPNNSSKPTPLRGAA